MAQSMRPWLFIASLAVMTLLPAPERPGLAKSPRPNRGGRFWVEYRAPEQNPDLAVYALAFAQSRAVDGLLAELERIIVLPQDIPVVFAECGEPNAFYSSKAQAIVVCYELPDHVSSLLSQAGVSPDQVGRTTGGVMIQAMFHELGHALIHLWDLPITGREEDAADQFSTFLLLQVGVAGEEALTSAAVFFLMTHEMEAAQGLAFWDEHALGAQRFYNLLCWLYGADPGRHAALVKAGYLPADRAVRCPSETVRLVRSWQALLGGWLRR